MKIKAICCLILLVIIGSVAAAQSLTAVQPSAPKPSPRPDCGPIKKSVTDWPQYQFVPSHTGYNPYESILSPATVGNLVLKWENQSGSRGTSFGMAVVNGMVYFGGDGVYAFNASTGCLRWTYTTSGPVNGSPAVVNGVVYVVSQFDVYALDAGTGALLWEFGSGGVGSPTVTNGVVYFGADNGNGDTNVYALDAITGVLLWAYTPVAAVQSSLAVANGVVYVGGGYDQTVYALNASTGSLLWEYVAGLYLDSPVVANGVVYVADGVGTGYSELYALDAGTGLPIWEYSLFGESPEPGAVANGVLYQGVPCCGLAAFDASTGALIWESGVAGGTPTVANGVVYSGGGEGKVYALDTGTGGVLWNYQLDGQPVYTAPAVADGVVYAGSVYGSAYAFSLPNQ
jgi:eukaryotic-like serine/threonine-protein kinase